MIATGGRRRRQEEAQDRHVDRAQVPEQIQKRCLRRYLVGNLREKIEGLAAVQELADAEVAAGQVFE